MRLLSAATSWRVLWAAILATCFCVSPIFAEEIEFRFDAGAAASEVFLAGEFNSWSPGADRMSDDDGDGVFELTLDLAEGVYKYKFVVDGTWIVDPNATETVDDDHGGLNGLLYVGVVPEQSTPETPASEAAPQAASGTHRFEYTATAGAAVFLAGEFNQWNASSLAMLDPDGDGVFELSVELAPGRYQYKFVVDGTWYEDPTATENTDDGHGEKNSIVEIGEEGGSPDPSQETDASAPQTGSVVAPQGESEAVSGQRSVVFAYQPVISGVNEVLLAGTFNDWSVGATPMTDSDGDGIYEAVLLLASGTYQYKFVVDGTWIEPTDADGYVDDGFGGKNAVIQIDTRFEAIEVERGDGEIYLEGLSVALDYSTLNEVLDGELLLQTRAYRDDVEGVMLHYIEEGHKRSHVDMEVDSHDPVFTNFRAKLQMREPGTPLRFTFSLEDGGEVRWASEDGTWSEAEPAEADWLLYTREALPRFEIPEWAQKATYYQIFPDRFANGDGANDQRFEESYYAGRNALPSGGKTNGEYFHFEEHWNEVAGLKLSPYRTDGKPDYFSFYGGDIRGVIDRLDYLQELGITVIYFNPVTDARSNHRYDPCDYNSIDPHLGTDDEFRELTREGLKHGIRVIVDMAFNHTGDCHFAFQDVVANWKDSEYYDWYEWKQQPTQWPLPAGANAIDYYDCWWGFGLHPNLNFDLSRPNQREMEAAGIEDAAVNWPVVEYLLSSADFWLGDLGVSGFRLDVPNEVPFWFWKLFRERCRAVKPDHLLIGEIWSDAGQWIRPDVFDAVMNYKYFKDPVVKWIANAQGNAQTFDQELSAGRSRYPIQAVRAQMNLMGSHDTVRFLDVAGNDARRLRLACTFSMTYLGSPHVYYGDELALAGGKDPDCRRTMPWSQIELPARSQTLDHYRKLANIRRSEDAFALGDFKRVLAQGNIYAYLRSDGEDRLLVVLNNGDNPATAMLPVGDFGISDGTKLDILLGDAGAMSAGQGEMEVRRGVLPLTVPAVDGVIVAFE